MLVLSRKFGESVHCKFSGKDGKMHDIKVKLINIGSKKAKLGFETDDDVLILREELLEKKAA